MLEGLDAIDAHDLLKRHVLVARKEARLARGSRPAADENARRVRPGRRETLHEPGAREIVTDLAHHERDASESGDVRCCVRAPAGYCRRDTLLALFWPDRDVARARAALSRAVHYLRVSLGDGVVLSLGDEELGVDSDRISCDAVRFREALSGHEVRTVVEMGWGGIRNGRLLALATTEFDAFLTVDKNIPYQQNLATLPVAPVVLDTVSNELAALLELVPELQEALAKLKPKSYVNIQKREQRK